jgi:anthranilate/para-aminobenzoate synthase component I
MKTSVKSFPIEYQDPFQFYKNTCSGYESLLMAYGKQSLVAPRPAVKITGKNEDFMMEAMSDAGCAILNGFCKNDFPYAHDLNITDGMIKGKVKKVVNPNIPENERVRQQNTSYVIRTVLEKFRGVDDDIAGLYGAFAYDFARNFEEFGDRFSEGGSPDFQLYIPTTLFHFDDRREKATIREFYFDGKHDEIEGPCNAEFSPQEYKTYEDMPLQEYGQKVAEIIEQIKDGRVMQCVLSRDSGLSLQRSPEDSYGELRNSNPSPYSFFFDFGKGEYLYGASPELHIGVNGEEIEIRPIAGTRKRSECPIRDARFRIALLNDKKELREHTMLVDLARNEMYRICYPHSVKVTDYLTIEEYPNLYHLVSGVRGKLNGFDALDALLTTIPAGTLSGAPKREAMKMIEELENSRRGYYGGAIGYLTFNGDCNTGITIRSVHVKDGMSHMRAGAGIVAHSTPEGETREIKLKSEKALSVLEVEK